VHQVRRRPPIVTSARPRERRGNSGERGYDRRWRKARSRFLALNPLCAKCLAVGRTTAATVVDHVKPHRGDKALFWDTTNWQALCTPHHNQKTGSGA
jgi:5-methylcytosine-specific restriction protein A